MKLLYSLLVTILFLPASAQVQESDSPVLSVIVTDQQARPIAGAVVALVRDSQTLQTAVCDTMGQVSFRLLQPGNYHFQVSFSGYQSHRSPMFIIPGTSRVHEVRLSPASITLGDVRVTARTPLVQQKQGKVILNLEASPTTAGSTVLELLEKSPGVNVDRNGGISLNGKPGVLVLIDDKPTYLSGADLNNLLSSMNAGQVAQVELMANPPARYDASGNAGIINIVTKKNRVKGFNGTGTVSAGQGVYPKNTNNLVLNFRRGKMSSFLTYNLSLARYLTDLYALRKYVDAGGALIASLDQPAYFSGRFSNQALKTGLDYNLSKKTTLGFSFGRTWVNRRGINKSNATWLNPAGTTDSSIATYNTSSSRFRNSSLNFNVRHSFDSKQDLSTDFDWLHYRIAANQDFNNTRSGAQGYQEASRGHIPTTIRIASGKIDYSLRLPGEGRFGAGWKSSSIRTDNIASYENFDGLAWVDDLGKSNHFIYRETIHAAYSSIERKWNRFSMQAGIRYENTAYNAHQLGNQQQKDSAFSRSYGGIFPSGSLSLEADSSNTLSLTFGRRIERPAFQNLNPFYFIINKYTYQTGNPFILPQYTWNVDLSHQYKSILTTTASISFIRNYFSQLFLADPARGVLLYTQGNVGQTINFGMTEAFHFAPISFWTVTGQLTYNHKRLKGFNGNTYTSSIDQLNINLTNQWNLARVYTAELSGFYTTKARNDIQELLYPTGQLSFGISRPLWKKKGTLRLNFRDIFYTNAMEGLTQFPQATEYFIIKRDSRVVSLALTLRFGKAYKTSRRSGSSADDEMERVGNGG